MSNRKQREFSLNVGTSTILFIFIVLVLVSFAILSLASATTDERMSAQIKENTTAYYEACNQAEETLATTDAALKSAYESVGNRTAYFDKVGKKQSYAFPISEIQTLNVEIKMLYPEHAGEPFYEVTRWQVITTGDLEYDTSLNVIK